MWKEPPADYVHTRKDYDYVDDGTNYGPITLPAWSKESFIIERYNAGPQHWCFTHISWEPMSKYPYPEA